MRKESLRTAVVCLALFVAAFWGTNGANAAEQNPCGAPNNDVCTYESNGCDTGEICVHLKCSVGSETCPTGSTTFTECWRCKSS